MLPPWLADDGVTLMAIVNVNPDSFSDPRADVDLDERLAASRAAAAAGAAIVDLGAQSAATHLPVVDPAVEVAALAPVVAGCREAGIPVSVDTYKPEVATAVLELGCDLLNDYSGLEHPEVVERTADAGAWYVLTHNRGRPKERLTEPALYDDVTADVIAFFTSALERVEALGLSRDRVVLDPGVDLSKTPRQTLTVLREADRIEAAFDQPLLWAISRKDVLGVITGRAPAGRDPATLALLDHLADRPRTLARVHDVAGCHDYLRTRAIVQGRKDLADEDLLDPSLYREPRQT